MDIDNSISILIGKSPFQRIKRKVKEVLESELSSTELIEGVSKKIPELQRRSFIDQIFRQLERYQINLDMLWPNSNNEEIGESLSALVKRRNVYLHQGRMEETENYSEDILRIQYLLEIWILRILDCSIDSVSTLAKPYFLK